MNKINPKNIIAIIIRWSLLAIVFLVPIYFAWFHENYTVFDLNKSVILRLFLTIIIISGIFFVSKYGQYFSIKKIKSVQIALLLCLAYLVSSLLSLHPTISLLGSYERQQGFLNLIAYILFFIFTVLVLGITKNYRNFIIATLAASFVVCCYGLLQFFNLDFLRWAESSDVRIFSTLGQPNFLGHYLVVVLPLSVYALFYIAKNIWWRVSIGVLIISELAALIFTYSRSAWLALIGAIIIGSLVYLWQKISKKISLALIVILLIFGVGLTWPSVRSSILKNIDYSQINVITRITSVLDFQSGSNMIRLKYWQASWDVLYQAPIYRKLFGFGPDVQASVFVQQYQADWGYYERMNSFPDRAHNSLLDNLLQFGLVGLILSAWLIFICIKPLVKNMSKDQGQVYWLKMAIGMSLIAYGVSNIFSFSLTAMAMMWYLLLALASSLDSDNLDKEWREIKFFQPISRWVIGLTIISLLLVWFFGFNVRPLVADYYYMQVKKAEVRSDCRRVLDDMEKVMEWYPASHFYSRIYLFHSTNCFAAVESQFSRQQLTNNLLDQISRLKTKENQFYTLIDLAHAYSIIGYYIDNKYFIEANNYYQELIKQNPYITISYQDYGRMKLWQGKAAEARKIFEEGIAATPPLEKAPAQSGHKTAIAKQLAYFYDLIGLSYYNDHDFTKASENYKKALNIDPTLTSSYKQLADIAYQLGRKDEAIQYNEKAYIVDPNNSVWPIGLAILYKEKGDFNKAFTYAEKAYNLEPENTKAKNLLEEIRLKKK